MSILKKLLIAAVVVVLLLAGSVVVASVFMPAGRSFTNEVSIDAPAEKVWRVITDKERYTEWQTQLERVEIIDDANWIEYPKSAPEPLKFHLASDGRPGRMEFSYTMGDSIHGHWKGELVPTATGVKLTTVDRYDSKSWLTKIMMGAFFDLDGFAKDWNNKLKLRAESLDR